MIINIIYNAYVFDMLVSLPTKGTCKMLLLSFASICSLIAIYALKISNRYADSKHAYADERLTQYWFAAIVAAVMAQLICNFVFDGFFGTFVWLLMLLTSYVISTIPLQKWLRSPRIKRSTAL
jgi:hypothetical protein